MAPFCHRLSRLNQPSPLDPKGSASLQTVPCQGPACALFLMDYDADGKAVGTGHCAEAVAAIAQSRLAAAVEVIAKDLIGDDTDDDTDGDQPTVDRITPKA